MCMGYGPRVLHGWRYGMRTEALRVYVALHERACTMRTCNGLMREYFDTAYITTGISHLMGHMQGSKED